MIPLTQAIETPGAILRWQLNQAADVAPEIIVTDLHQADWLWQLIGPEAFAQLHHGATPQYEFDTELVTQLRKMAHTWWLHDWWPTSLVDGLAPLDQQLLIQELNEQAEQLAEVCVLEVPDLETTGAKQPARTDYALAASSGRGTNALQPQDAIATGTASLDWQGVPAGTFDATEYPVSWNVDAPGAVTATVNVLTLQHPRHTPAGVSVELRSGSIHATGELDASGTALLSLPMEPQQAWAHDWSSTLVTIGIGSDEPSEVRERVRQFARARLDAAARGGDALTTQAERDVAEQDF